MTNQSLPKLDDLLVRMGEAGRRLFEMDACEGAAGNLSICLRGDLDIQSRFPLREQIDLPKPAPDLAGTVFLVSGSGRRLRDILDAPTENVGCLVVDEGGVTGQLFTAPDRQFSRLTSEFNTHFGVHYDQVITADVNFHAIVHAQPPHITYLSHIEQYQDVRSLNRHLLRWEPETIIIFPQGIGVVKFEVPGSSAMEKATVESLHTHTLTIWSKHGVMARSDTSIMQACDRVEYAEAAARFEYLNLAAGEISSGLSADEIHAICRDFKIEQKFF